jgi:hypothetical protein
MRTTSASFLTTKRLRAHGLVLAVCLWSVYLWNMSTPGLIDRTGNLKGTDFLHFYTLGSLALAHDGADLYNVQAQWQLAECRVPAAAGIRYLALYPPQVSILFQPFARLSYGMALALWLGLSASIYGACCYTIWRACPNLRDQGSTVLILAIAFPAFWHLILWGQTSALALACFTLAFLALRAKGDFLAGLALGSLIFKPQLGLAAAILFACTLRWKVIFGAAVASAAQLMTGFLYYGARPLRNWIATLLSAPRQLAWFEPRPYQTHCLRTFWAMLIPWPSLSLALYLVSAVIVSALMIACWRSRSMLSLSARYSALLFGTVLLAPHLTVYDVVNLAPAFLLLSDWIAGGITDHPEYFALSGLKPLLYLAFLLPLLGPFARWTRFQFSVPVMAIILYVVWKSRSKLDVPSDCV